MWLQESRSISNVPIVRSTESFADRSCEILVTKVPAITKEKKYAAKSLEQHLFCALVPKFFDFTIPDGNQEPNVPQCPLSKEPSERSKVEEHASELGSIKSISTITKKSGRMSRKISKHPRRKTAKGDTLFPEEISKGDHTEEDQKVSLEKALGNLTSQNTGEQETVEDIYYILEAPRDTVEALSESIPINIDFLNGNKFEGQLNNCQLNGQGRYVWADSTVYEGTFQDSKIHGLGQLTYPDGISKYYGNFQHNLKHGKGQLVLSNLKTYKGYWFYGKKHLQAAICYDESNWYNGEILNGLRNGWGKRRYPSGSEYHGNWQNGVKHGQGIMYWKGDYYSGHWKNNLMDGEGKYVWEVFPNCQFVLPMQNYYFGQWENGLQNGHGTLYLSDGTSVETFWKNGKKSGPGKLVCLNGTVVKGNPLFIDNTFVLLSCEELQASEALTREGFEKLCHNLNKNESFDEDHIDFSSIFAPYAGIDLPPYMLNLDFHIQILFNCEWKELFDYEDELSYFISENRENLKGLVPNFLYEYLKASEKEAASCLTDSDSDTEIVSGIKYSDTSSDIPTFRAKGRDISILVEEFMEESECILDTTSSQSNSSSQKTEPTTTTTTTDQSGVVESCRICPVIFARKQAFKKGPVYAAESFQTQYEKYLHELKIDQADQYKSRVYRYEERYLRRMLKNNYSILYELYYYYATICCTEKPKFSVGMMRMMLWKLLICCGLYEIGLSIIEFDELAVGRRCDPFEYVPISEMIHYLLLMAWLLYTKSNKFKCKTSGILAGGFQTFIERKVLIAKKMIHAGLFTSSQSIPIKRVYQFYQTIGPDLTFKKLLNLIFKDVRACVECQIKPMNNQLISETIEVQNYIAPGADIFFKNIKGKSDQKKPEVDNFFSLKTLKKTKIAKATVKNHGKLIKLEVFAKMGQVFVIDLIARCLPLICQNETMELGRTDVQISFLEFCEIFMQLLTAYTFKISPAYQEKRKQATDNYFEELKKRLKPEEFEAISQMYQQLQDPLSNLDAPQTDYVQHPEN